ncbi:MAG: polysaccharide deacetylase family protein [Clostridium sp.]|uniref:polysaccharide deacetylase family protein n=1 Tax=Clostridium sp. TaxID=1506 RepID=UPI003EE4A608
MKLKKKISIGAAVIIGLGVIGSTYVFNNKAKAEELYAVPVTKDVQKDVENDKKDVDDAKREAEEKVKLEEAENKRIEEERKKLEEEKKREEIKKAEEKKKEEEKQKLEEAKKKENEKNTEVVENVQPVSGSNIISSAKGYAVPAKEVNAMLNGKKNGKKEVFLTFDDGPSSNTPKVLEILKKYGVHGTFFVLGSNVESSSTNKQYLKDVYNSGNAIANHTYSHNFKTLYPGNRVNVTNFMNELNKTNNLFKSVLGNDFSTRVMRMPGGYMSRQYYKDGNLGALNNALNNAGIVSLDWNVDSSDASGVNVSSSKILSNTIKEAGNSEDVVVLMHDASGKGTTVQALPQIIEYFKNKGYTFKVISN